MLLAVDVGNTNITLGVFMDGVLIGNFRLNTRVARTSDEYGIAIRNILYHNGIELIRRYSKV
ncbi:MAG: type III pantothenate kinase [Candidatus Weimeria sp.]